MNTSLTDSRRQALRRASQWYAVLSDGQVSAQQTARWQRWYEEDQDNQWAWQQVENLRSQLSSVPGGLAHRALNDTQLTRRRVMKGLLLLLSVGGGWRLWQSGTAEGLRADYRTAKGSIRQQRLEDGTLLTLNTNSAVDVRYNADQRLLRLIYGEIAITTAKDPLKRPFLVQTPQGMLTALGTAFTVRVEGETVWLSVQQHAVQAALASDPTQTRLVDAGQRLHFRAAEFGTIEADENEEHSWTQGVLSFSDRPLGEVINTLARYRYGVLRCDPAVANLRISGTFPLAQSDRVLETLAKTLPIKIQYMTRYWVNVTALN